MEQILQWVMVCAAVVLCLVTGDYRISCLILGICIAALLISGNIFWKKRERRIEELTGYLMKVQDGLQIPELSEYREGQLGILQSEIYKLVVLLKEHSDSEMRQKLYLADMLSDISHQIKTPLTAITLMTDLLREERTEEKRQEFVKNIDKQAAKITWLIRNLLTLSQLEADTMELKRERISAEKLLNKACQPLELLAEVKGVALAIENEQRRDLEGFAPDMEIVCDGDWTAEAFSNIIKNCVEHTSKGGMVRIRLSQNNFYTQVAIEDNGCGIAKDDLPHIFERFYKGKYGSKDSVGIGLAMAKQVIGRQNGTITVESEEGRGSRFFIRFYA